MTAVESCHILVNDNENQQGETDMTLKELPIGKTATVRTVGGEGALRQHFLDMGIIPGAEVTMVKYAPMLSLIHI